MDYTITVTTSSGDYSAFDGNVRFKMSSGSAESAPVTLAKGNMESGPFKAGGVDVFKIRALPMSVQNVYVDLDYSGECVHTHTDTQTHTQRHSNTHTSCCGDQRTKHVTSFHTHTHIHTH